MKKKDVMNDSPKVKQRESGSKKSVDRWPVDPLAR
jgi:hypothetical protein